MQEGLSQIYGHVLGILSGDSLIVEFENINPSIQIVSLEHLVAPKFGSPDGQVQDEPHGFESWQFMRNQTIGRIIYVKPQSKKNDLYRSHPAFGKLSVMFGKVTIYNYDLGLLCVRNGWVRIRAPPNTNAYIQELVKCEQEARKEKLGIWGPNGYVRKLPVPFDPKNLISIWEFDAIVDSVVNGTTLSLFLLPEHQHIIFRVAACRSPSAKKDSTNTYGFEAKNFTIHELLHRTIRVRLCSCNEAELFIGPILSKEDYAIRNLISHGLAQFNIHTADLTPSAYEYERCEAEAKAQCLKIFENYDKKIVQENMTFEGVVIQIIGSCAFRINVHGETRLVQFSCLHTTDFVAGVGSYYLGFETREFLRKMLIGQTVTVKVDGIVEGRCYGTVYFRNECINVLLCQEGLANVINPFIGKPSEMFDKMNQAMIEAKNNMKGIFQIGVFPNVIPLIDLSVTIYSEYTLKYFPELIRGSLSGIIEQILGGNRFIVLVPGRFLLRLAVNGLLPISTSDVHGRHSTNYSIEHYLNRDIEFDVCEVDKSGGILANMYLIQNDQPKLSIAYDLLKHGFAEVHKRTIKDIPNFEKLEEAQNEAMQQMIGKWSNLKLDKPQVEFDKFYSVKIIEVLSPTILVVQYLSETMREIISFLPSATTPLTKVPSIGSFVCALINDTRYRARVESNSDENCIKLTLIDYEVPAEASFDKLYELPPRLLSIEPQAVIIRLAFLDEDIAPPDSTHDATNDSSLMNNNQDIEYVENITKNKRLFMYIAYFTEYPEALILDKSNINSGNLNSMVLINTKTRLINTDIDIHTQFRPVINKLIQYQSMKNKKQK